MASFIGSLPSSFLVATFAHCLFTPRNCLQKYLCVFSSISSFSQVLKLSLSQIPQTSKPYKRIGRKRESKSLLVTPRDNFEKSK